MMAALSGCGDQGISQPAANNTVASDNTAGSPNASGTTDSSGTTTSSSGASSGSTGGSTNGSLTVGTTGGNTASVSAAALDCARMSLGDNGDLNGFRPLPNNNPWNQDISQAPLASDSASRIANYISRAGNAALSGDFGTIYGEDYNIVDSSVQSSQNLNITMYPTESDIMPVPISNSALIESSAGGDRHVFIFDRSKCWLYETWGTTFDGTKWNAANLAVWDMLNTTERPYNWTSGDAAGLAIFPGLFRYDEIARGEINHAIRFTLKSTANAYVAPATHSAGSDSNSFPMGTRFRLKSNYDISKFPRDIQVILTAMKKYGVILADNGIDFQLAGTHHPGFHESDVPTLKAVHFSDMELISQPTPIIKTNPPAGPAPTINSFTASSVSVNAGQNVTLSWSTANDSWDFIDVLGPVRGSSITINPRVTTTYTLNATNIHGRTKKSITVTVK